MVSRFCLGLLLAVGVEGCAGLFGGRNGETDAGAEADQVDAALGDAGAEDADQAGNSDAGMDAADGATACPVASGLPPGWTSMITPDAASGCVGRVSWTEDQFELGLESRSADGSTEQDIAAFGHLSGDGILEGRLIELAGSSEAAVAFFLRASPEAEAAFVELQMLANGRMTIAAREVTGGPVVQYSVSGTRVLPRWMRLYRRGRVVSIEASEDGRQWEQLRGLLLDAFVADLQAGWLLRRPASETGSVVARAVSFELLSTRDLPSSWSLSTVGSLAEGAQASTDEGTLALSAPGPLAASGSDDALAFLSFPLDGDGTLSTKLVSLADEGGAGFAGLAFRDSSRAGAVSATLRFTSGQEVALSVRERVNEAPLVLGSRAASLPLWLRLVREGDLVLASMSTDGQEWTPVASHPLCTVPRLAQGLVAAGTAESAPAQSVFGEIIVVDPVPATFAAVPNGSFECGLQGIDVQSVAATTDTVFDGAGSALFSADGSGLWADRSDGATLSTYPPARYVISGWAWLPQGAWLELNFVFHQTDGTDVAVPYIAPPVGERWRYAEREVVTTALLDSLYYDAWLFFATPGYLDRFQARRARLRDGGFEQQSDAWTASGAGIFSFSTTRAASGERSAALAGAGTVTQVLDTNDLARDLPPGQFLFRATGLNDGLVVTSEVSLALTFEGQPEPVTHQLPFEGYRFWTSRQLVFTVPTEPTLTAAEVRLQRGVGDGVFHVDDIFIAPAVP